MSTLINLYCDSQWEYGGCTGQLITEASTLAEAREIGDTLGWRAHPDGRDYCPACSGRGGRRGATVTSLPTVK